MVSACELLLVTAVGCGGASAVTDAQAIPFTDHGSTQQSGFDGGARVVVATDPGATGLGQVVSGDATRLYIAVFAGSQRTGGYDIRVARIERAGSTITVRATFVTPAPGALTIQVLTSPAQLVSIERQSAASTRDVVVVDQSGAERARGTVPQSQP